MCITVYNSTETVKLMFNLIVCSFVKNIIVT